MDEKRPPSLFRNKLELLILSQSEDVLQRAKQVVSNYFLTYKQIAFGELPLQSLGEFMKAQVILLAQEKDEPWSEFTQRVEQALRFFPRSRLITVVESGFVKESAQGVQNSRVTPLSQAEFFSTLKFEYLCLYRCRGQYYEIDVTDLFPMTTMLFPAYVRLSLNQRYLAAVYSNTVLSDERFQRLQNTQGLFIWNKDSEKYLQYINNYYDTSGMGLRKRARALFLTLSFYSQYLNENVLFDLKNAPPEHISGIYGDIKIISEQIFQVMKSEENLWDVFREALETEFNPFWRAPWIAIYAAYMSVKSGVGDPLTTLLAGLVMDVGLYDLEENITRTYLLSEDKKLPEASQSGFQKHPLLSLNRCLIKRIPLEEHVKSVLVCTHERADEKGFPNQVPAEKLPVEAQLLLFAEKIDQGVLTTMRQTGVGFRFLKEKIWEAESSSPGAFSSEFLRKIADSLI